eukprot:9799876-Karenia_brevis.AAC.1
MEIAMMVIMCVSGSERMQSIQDNKIKTGQNFRRQINKQGRVRKSVGESISQRSVGCCKRCMK